MSTEGTRRAIVAAFLANLGIALSKFAGVRDHGIGLDARGVDPLRRRHRQPGPAVPRRQAQPQGSPRPSTRSASAPSATSGRSSSRSVLFTLGSLFALYEGVEKLIDPHELESPIWAFGVLGVAIVLESLSLRTARRRGRSQSPGPFVVALHPHHQEPRAARRAARGHRRAHRPALRADRHQPRRDHRQPALGRAGQHRHRTAARRDRGDPRRRDEEPA